MPDSAAVTQSPVVTSASIHSLTSWTSKNGLVSERNWFTFSRFMKMWFKGIGASYVTDTSVKSVPASKMDLDNSMQIHLLGTIEEDSQQPVLEADTTLDAWKGLVKLFETSTMARRIEARRHFFNVEHDASQPITVYIQAVKDARAVLKALGCEPDDVMTADVLLMNLHSSFESVCTTICVAETEPKLASIISSLITSGSATSINQESSPMAMAARVGSGGRRFGGSSRHGSNSDNWRKKEESDNRHRSGSPSRIDSKGFRWCDPTHDNHCHRCGRQNHIAARCVYDMPQQVKDWVLGGPWRSEAASESANMAFASVANGGTFPDAPSDSDSESYEYGYEEVDPRARMATF